MVWSLGLYWFAFQVKLGNFEAEAGGMLYPGSTDVTLIVAVTLGVALPILLAVLVIVICLRRESLRRAKEKKKQRPPSTIELGGGGEKKNIESVVPFEKGILKWGIHLKGK